MSALVNTSKKIALLVLLVAAIIISIQFTQRENTPAENIKKLYLSELAVFKKKILVLKNNIAARSSVKILQASFRNVRLAYKKTAIIIEFYNPYEAKSINGPALKWINENNPLAIFDPHGLQVMEELIFSDQPALKYADLKKEADLLLKIIQPLETEKELDYKFREELIFEALQSAVIRVITMGISGFDSPIAQYSIPEAKSTLQSLQSILAFYKNKFIEKTPDEFNKLNSLLQSTIQYLSATHSFNSFDRLGFIKKYLSPVYSLLVKLRVANNLIPEGDRTPLNPMATSLFDSTAFNINAFSPTIRYRPTRERIELGRKLFYDPILSTTGKRTCGTCHKPELAFTDGLKTALAVDEKTYLLRNTPTLWNSALQKKQFYDSRTVVLENQLSDVVHNQEEMKGSLKESVVALQNHPAYTEMFAKAYPNENEKITPYNISNAISSYMRSLVSFNSAFDKYMRNDESQLRVAAKKGFNLFMGKAKCATCHYIPLFNGLIPPFFGESESEVLSVPKTKDKNPAIPDEDKGKFLFTQSPLHLYSFKTPTLRNIELTGPYMHNGVFTTLEEVMEFYNNGGGAGLKIARENQTLPADKLNLTKKEIADIISFMKTLTDTTNAH